VIAGGRSVGLLVAGGSATGNQILGNFIGTNAAGTAKIAVEFMSGDLAVAAGLGAGGDICGAGAAGRVTLNVFWHFPHRMVRPCGPIRASSTR